MLMIRKAYATLSSRDKYLLWRQVVDEDICTTVDLREEAQPNP